MCASPLGSPRRVTRSGWWVLSSIGLCLLLLAVRFALPIWQRAAFLNEIERIGGNFNSSKGGPPWLRNLLGDYGMRGFDEVWSLSLPGKIRPEDMLLGVDDAPQVGAPTAKIENGLLTRTLLFPGLIAIHLDGTTFDNQGIAVLGTLPKLGPLYLFDSNLDDEGLSGISNSKSILHLFAGYTRVTDASLSRLRQMTQLEYLGLRGDDITDAGLASLSSLINLTDLNLSETHITDAGLRHLAAARKLQRVDLFDTAVSEAGVLEFVANHPNLEELQLSPDQISANGMDDLQRQNPALKVVIMVNENDGSGFSRRKPRR